MHAYTATVYNYMHMSTLSHCTCTIAMIDMYIYIALLHVCASKRNDVLAKTTIIKFLQIALMASNGVYVQI